MADPRVIRAALIQTRYDLPGDPSLTAIKEHMVAKATRQIEQAAAGGAKLVCLQEIFFGPYWCCETRRGERQKWFGTAERSPDGPTAMHMSRLAKEHGIVLIVPIFEEDTQITAKYFNAAMIFDADGRYLGRYRKSYIPDVEPGFFEKHYFTPGDTGYLVFETEVGNVGIYICHDRHFTRGYTDMAIAGADIIVTPSATVTGLSDHLWQLEQPAMAAMNMLFIGALNRPGVEAPWEFGEFYGNSYWVGPDGKLLCEPGSKDGDDIVIANLDFAKLYDVRQRWKFHMNQRDLPTHRVSRTGVHTRVS